jgi:anti-sigma factor (TIGR02949 family)
MSCGNPHEVDCTEVLSRVSLFLEHSMSEHGELGYDSIEQHLYECGPCLDQVGEQVEELANVIRAMLHRCCSEHAPEELKARVVQRLHVGMQARGGASSDRSGDPLRG